MISEKAKSRLVEIRIERFNEDVDAISVSLLNGRITLNMWQEEFKLLLRQLHTGATAIGVGGWENATSKDWGRTGPILKEQYRFLHGFAQAIFDQRETISLAAVQARAHLYGEKAGFTANIAQAGDIARLLPFIPRDGSTECLNRCMCRWVTKILSQDVGMQNVRFTWKLSPVENCPTCLGREDKSVVIAVPEEINVPPFIGNTLT